MKKFFAAIMAASMMLSLVACGNGAATSGNASASKPATSTPAVSTPAASSTPAAEEGLNRVIFLNNAFGNLEMTSQCYNAKEYHAAYNMGEIIDDNFWFTPDAGTEAKTVAYTDFYEDVVALDVFRGKYISFAQDNPEYDYDLFVGRNQKESADVKYKGYIVVDNEVILLMQDEGWNVAELFEYVGMVEVEKYDFICADGYTHTLRQKDLAEVAIIYKDGRVDCTLPDDATYTLQDIRYIVPKDLTKDTIDPNAEGVQKINVALNAIGVYKTEAPYSENRAGTYYDAYSLAELFTEYAVTECNKVKVIATDGYSQREDFEDITSKYITYQGPNAKGDHKEWFTLGKTQARDTGVWHIGYMMLDKEAFVFIPDAGIAMSAIISETGMITADSYELTYADGKTETKSAADLAAMTLAADSTLVSVVAK